MGSPTSLRVASNYPVGDQTPSDLYQMDKKKLSTRRSRSAPASEFSSNS